MSDRLKHYLEALVIIVSAFALWLVNKPSPATVDKPVIATPAPEVKEVQKQEIHPPKVVVYAPQAKKKLGLPDDTTNDPNGFVLGASWIPADTHPHDVTTVINEKTGEVQTYDTRKPMPWLSAEQTGEVRLDYGYKTDLVKAARLSLREDLIQVKALHAGVNLSLDSDRELFAGVGIGWRW